ncbi:MULTISPECIES: ABC transporter permease [unclassified Brenneria]|uniref:ABC transporter permease n=1 Tax=unclassified Brenneria TaxID=2634434 RepID=UPI00155622BE|nr:MULTISPECIES: ABC transporter permease [unclassified Brenneria]MBJ7221040.1 ABC transporter permease [Brenneria sp. L3-3C-1]MEE3642281.1 ABC transporter permease [Brenneria sp. L3_3C_1]MEE3650347.1 ABC transporter permease [Brenneria sp. HEZEL_4_2_4]NPD00303.1 ABC transporter permease [Brenneria sp. hezel4-2-4]
MRWLLQPSATIGLTILLAVLTAAGAASRLFPEDPMNMVGVPYLWPGQDVQFPLGTDLMGRDILAGLFHGARVSLLVGIASTVMALLIGIAVGVASGFYRGRVDSVLTGITMLFQTIPAFLLAIILVAVLQPSIATIIFALGITSWTSIARLVRTEFLALREREFVRASISLGAGDMHLIFREILPNAWTPVVVSTALLIANAILSEAGLSFLGLGDPNVVSWGSMIGTGRDALRTGWYMTALPGVAIMLTVMALNLLSDALHTALNPRLRRSGSTLSIM